MEVTIEGREKRVVKPKREGDGFEYYCLGVRPTALRRA